LSSNWITNPGVWSYGVALAAFAGLALRLVVRWQPGGKPAMLLAFVLTTALAAAGACIFAVWSTLITWAAAVTLDLLRSAATLGFLVAFLGVRDSSKGAQRAGAWWIALACIGAALIIVQWLIGVPPPAGLETERFSHPIGFAAALAIAIFGLVLVEQCYRRTPAASRWHVRPLLLGFAGLMAYDLILYSDALLFRALDADLWAARGFAQAITVPLFVLTMDRTHNWSFELSVSRGVLVGSTALAASGAYLMLMAGAGFILRFAGGSWGRALEAALVFAALLLLVMIGLSATFRAKVRVFVAKHFFTYRYDYRQEWLKFTNTLTSMSAAQPWAACIQALGDLVESPGGALWLKNASGQYRQVARVSLPTIEGAESASGPFLSFLKRTGWVLEISDVLLRPTTYDNVVVPASIANLPDAWLIVPLQTADDLVGYVVLNSPRVQIEIDWEVRDLLKTAGRQAASYLAYAMATESLLEARKFDAFHRLSTFVVHDLKNLIAQLQLLLSNVERHRDNPDFQRDMLRTIEHVVDRMHQLTLQLRPDRTGGDRANPVDVAFVAKRVQALRAAGRPGLTVEVADGILAWAHEDRLERVLAHLVQNAFDASGREPEVRLRSERIGDEVLIEVSDHGSGMTAEFMRERLFKPFQSTKDTGMGIGAFECQQYVQQVGGSIDVQSEPSVGTSVRVRLRAVAESPTAEGALA
jgi:putative PEP-CTERM system histidine kinase